MVRDKGGRASECCGTGISTPVEYLCCCDRPTVIPAAAVAVTVAVANSLLFPVDDDRGPPTLATAVEPVAGTGTGFDSL